MISEDCMKLEVKNIFKNFSDKEVLKGISFSAESGEAFGLLGRNGAGKTTSIRILMDVFPSDSGEILIDGKPIDHSKIRIGYLPEERGLYPKKKIVDQLVYFAMLNGLSKHDALKSVDNWLNRLQMIEYKNKRLDTLSKGNQQKIQLVTALAHNPQIIILDEPFSGLDPVNAMTLKEVVKEEISRGKIVIFSSHQMNYIEEFCDKIAIINNGKIAIQGSIREIKRNYTRNRLVISTEYPQKIISHFGSRCMADKNGELTIKLKSAEDKNKTMKEIIDNFDVDEIKVFEPSLNDIFVKYTNNGGQEIKNETI